MTFPLLLTELQIGAEDKIWDRKHTFIVIAINAIFEARKVRAL
jgi:hypothetical protein